MIYLDTSALVKKYFQEPGTDTVREILRGSGGLCGISKIAYAEVCAAFGRKNRENPRERRAYRKAFHSFHRDWRLLTIVEVSDDLLPLIRALTDRHPLRGADAIHLASAVWLQRALRDEVAFVASDGDLLTAARKEKLKIINPVEGATH